MKYTLKSRHLITLKACSAKWKITVRKEETFLLNLHNFVNVNIPVLTQSSLFVCYCLFHEIDSLISLSAEEGSSAFSNHRGKSNKLYTSRMHFAVSSCNWYSMCISSWLSHSNHISVAKSPYSQILSFAQVLLLEGQPKCLTVQCEFFHLSWTVRHLPATQDLLLSFQGWLPHSQELFHFK